MLARDAIEPGLLVVSALLPWFGGLSIDRSLAIATTIYCSTCFCFTFFSGEAHSASVSSVSTFAAALTIQLLPGAGVPPVVSICIFIVLIAWTYLRLVRIVPPAGSLSRLDGKVVVVTGSSAGLGESTAQQLLGLGATVVFACRSESRARAAMQRACKASGAPVDHALFIRLDMASCDSIRECARQVCGLTKGRLDALVCNAGAMSRERQLTCEGWEHNLACHALGHHLLAQLLLPALLRSSGRIVAVSSCLHRKANAAEMLADPMSERTYGMFDTYARSKLMQVILTNELHRRYAADGLVCTSLHPGNSITEVTRGFHPAVRRLYDAFHFFLRCVQTPVADGAVTTVFAVASARPGELCGAYLERCTPVAPVTAAIDETVGRCAWELSERLLAPWAKPL